MSNILIRLSDTPCCTTDVTVLGPGKGPHAGELKCQACGRHRRWIPAAAFSLLQQFQNETARVFGPSDEIPVMQSSTIQFGDKTVSFEKKKFEQKDNSGSLFKNQKKTADTHADYTGSIVFDGRECWLSAWIKTSKSGTKYMSLSLKAKEGDV